MMTSTLVHYGVMGQKWGVRRYQNEDGSLTSAGKERYGKQNVFENQKAYKGLVTTSGGVTNGLFSIRKRDTAKNNLSKILSSNGLGNVGGITYVDTWADNGGIEYKVQYLGNTYGVDELDELKEAIVNKEKHDAEMDEKRKDIRAKLEKAKAVVDSVLDKVKAAATKVKDVVKSTLETGKLWAEEIFKMLNVKDYSKTTTTTASSTIMREKGTAPKSSNPLNIQTKRTTKRRSMI